MALDVVDLRNFYGTPLGGVVRRFVGLKVRARWTDVTGRRVLGIGFAVPLLSPFRGEAERVMAFMPAAQGVIEWPGDASNLTALVEETELPLPDASVDRVLVMHLLEEVDSPLETLREIWRVLAPGGSVILVVPNRRGIWARSDSTPFGHGRPFSRGQLIQLLRGALFSPVAWSEALWMPPSRRAWILKSAVAIERAGAHLAVPIAGVHVVEATKQVYRPVAVKTRRFAVPRMSPVLLPSPAGARREAVLGGLEMIAPGAKRF